MYYALYTLKGKLLSFDPAKDRYWVVTSYEQLEIWDYQTYDDPAVWFMGNNAQPKISFKIKAIPKKHLSKLK